MHLNIVTMAGRLKLALQRSGGPTRDHSVKDLLGLVVSLQAVIHLDTRPELNYPRPTRFCLLRVSACLIPASFGCTAHNFRLVLYAKHLVKLLNVTEIK